MTHSTWVYCFVIRPTYPSIQLTKSYTLLWPSLSTFIPLSLVITHASCAKMILKFIKQFESNLIIKPNNLLWRWQLGRRASLRLFCRDRRQDVAFYGPLHFLHSYLYQHINFCLQLPNLINCKYLIAKFAAPQEEVSSLRLGRFLKVQEGKSGVDWRTETIPLVLSVLIKITHETYSDNRCNVFNMFFALKTLWLHFWNGSPFDNFAFLSTVKIDLSRGTLPGRDKCLAINFDALIQTHKFRLVKQGQRRTTTTGRTRGGRGGVRPS